MLLKDTVNMMESEDYRERFKAEYYQTAIRYRKLCEMLEKWDQKNLDFTPVCPRSTYNLQVKTMADYLAVLEIRAVAEGIDLREGV